MTDFTQARNDFARAFCHDEITRLAPLYDALERDTLAMLKRWQSVSKHDKTALESALSERGFEWQAVSARLKAARQMLDRLAQRTAQPEHIAIVGSRDFQNLQAVIDYVNSLPDNAVIVSGGAAGVDSTAAQAAQARGLAVIEFLPDWKQYGKRAGFLRNADIVNAADRVVAFWNGISKGTKHSIELAQKAGKPVDIKGE